MAQKEYRSLSSFMKDKHKYSKNWVGKSVVNSDFFEKSIWGSPDWLCRFLKKKNNKKSNWEDEEANQCWRPVGNLIIQHHKSKKSLREISELVNRNLSTIQY